MKTTVKKTLLTTLIFTFCITAVNAQRTIDEVLSDPNLNYFEISAEVKKIIDKMPDPKTEEQEKQIKLYNRWDWFWSKRIDAKGGFSIYPREIRNYNLNKAGNKSFGLPVWKPVGPYQDNVQSQYPHNTDIGRVMSLWVDPDDTDIILAGSHGGGLWKSVDGGINWNCLTPDIHGGISNIAVDPNNINNVYIITGIGFSGFSNQSYAMGIYKSTDGGSTFNPMDNGIDAIYLYYMNEILIDPTRTWGTVCCS